MFTNLSVVGSVAESSFNPKQIPNLVLWLDSADSSTIYNNPTGSVLAAHSQSVGRWEDKSGNNYHAYQFTASRQPRYVTASLSQSLGVLNFVAEVTSSFELTSSAFGILRNKSAISVFGTYIRPAMQTALTLLSISTSNLTSSRYELSVQSPAVVYRTSRLDGTATVNTLERVITTQTTGSTDFVPYSVSNIMRFNEGTSSRVYEGGSLSIAPSSSYTASFSSYTGSTSNTDSARILVGARTLLTANNTSGSICEILYYDRALNDAERRSVERYLHRKWNRISYDQKTSTSSDIFSNVNVYVDANNIVSNPGSGSTWYDLSGNGRNGTLENGASFQVSDGISYVDCDGTDDNVNFGNILNYTTASFSISIWFSADINAGDPGLLPYYKGSFQNNGYYAGGDVGNTRGGFNFNVNRSGEHRNAGTVSPALIGAIVKNTYTMVTVTRSGREVTIYVNGVRSNSFNLIYFDPASSSENFRLAQWPGYITSKMRIGMFMAHDKQLNSIEVLDLYNFTKRAYAKFD